MGTRGPVGKRDDERIRRNVPEVETTKVSAIGTVPVPPLDIENAHQLVIDLYESMKQSAQSRFYEPTDWQVARLTLDQINKSLNFEAGAISAMKLSAFNQMLSNLLLTEGDRRRVRLEIERKPDGPVATVTSIADVYREQLRSKPST